MVYKTLLLVFPVALAWLLQRLFHSLFHPTFLEREVTSEGKKTLNPYFNVGYASSSYKKQKDAFQRMLYVVGFSFYATIVLPMFWMDNPIDRVLDDQEMKFSAAFQLSALVLSTMYINDLLWNDNDHVLIFCHHLAAVLSIFILVTDPTILPVGLVFIRATTIPFQDTFPCVVAVVTRFNWVADIKLWNTLRMYFYVGTNLICWVLEWLYFIYYYKGNSFLVYVCVACWQATETYGFYVYIDFVRNMPKIIKKKIERETKYMTDLDQDKEDPCGGESLEDDVHCEPSVSSDVHCELSVSE